jgi:putative endonuclease
MKEHQEGKSFATSYRRPWRLIYYEAYLEEEDAIGREKFLKSGSGRRFLKNQLRHHLGKYPMRSTA